MAGAGWIAKMIYANDPRKTAALWLMAILGACVLALTGSLIALILSVSRTVDMVPVEIEYTRAALIAETHKQAAAVLALVDRQARGIRWDATAQLSGIRADALGQLSHLSETADRQLTGTRKDLTDSIAAVIAPVNGLRTDLQPVLENISLSTIQATALIKDAQDSWDDSYDDVKGLLESTTYATTQVAQTAETIRAAAPEFIATTQESNRQLAGVAGDVHKLTTSLTAPVSLKAKIWNAIRGVALVASHF
jgi:methyl-accepting chemotaxis protein